MARPQKKGLEYFPLDVNFYNDIKIRKLMRNVGGGKAAFVYIAMLCKIYESGYYMVWDDDMSFLLSDITGFEEGMIRECVNFCLSVGLFDKDIYDSYHVLTSSSIQERYFSVAAKRRVHDVNNLPYLLISVTETHVPASEMQTNEVSATQTGVSVTETRVNETETDISAAKTPLKKSKVKDNSSLRSEYPSSSTTPTTRVRDGDERKTISPDVVVSPEEPVDVALAVEELKKDRAWLLEVQQNNGMAAWNIVQWLDIFVNECKCRGKEEHDGLGDVKRHFLDWMKKKGVQGKKSGKKGDGSGGPDTADLERRWNRLVAELCKGVSAEEASEAYTLMRFESYDPKERKLLIQVVDSKVYELLESKYSKPFMASIKKYFGSITLKYRVMNKNS